MASGITGSPASCNDANEVRCREKPLSRRRAKDVLAYQEQPPDSGRIGSEGPHSTEAGSVGPFEYGTENTEQAGAGPSDTADGHIDVSIALVGVYPWARRERYGRQRRPWAGSPRFVGL